MSALTDFLLARIAEDEADARRLLKYAQENALSLEEPRLLGTTQIGWHEWPDVEKMCGHVLADIEAKRRIVERAESVNAASAAARHTGMFERVWELDRACRILATPYSDHPDYRQEWKP